MKMTFPADDLLRIVRNDPNGTKAAHFESCWREFQLRGHHAHTIFSYWFDHQYPRIKIEKNKDGFVISMPSPNGTVGPKRPAVAAGSRKKNDTKVRKLVDAISQVVLMDLCTSTGKKIRDCTFGELKKEAGWLGAIAKLGKPNEIVGKKLKESDLFNVRMRNTAA